MPPCCCGGGGGGGGLGGPIAPLPGGGGGGPPAWSLSLLPTIAASQANLTSHCPHSMPSVHSLPPSVSFAAKQARLSKNSRKRAFFWSL